MGETMWLLFYGEIWDKRERDYKYFWFSFFRMGKRQKLPGCASAKKRLSTIASVKRLLSI